jgi:hypothetical protein
MPRSVERDISKVNESWDGDHAFERINGDQHCSNIRVNLGVGPPLLQIIVDGFVANGG